LYHVTLRGNHQQPVFLSDEDRDLLNTIVARAVHNFDARLHAYCWMTNHLHLLLQVGASPLTNPMRNIAAEYARAMQIKLRTTGHFFERRYHATLVELDSYLLELIRYIHLNPVRAGIVSQPSRYPWSSHHSYIGTRQETWVTTEFGLSMFARDRQSATLKYLEFLDCPADISWASSLASNGGKVEVFGGAAFVSRIQTGTSVTAGRQSLEALIDEACKRFNIDAAQLGSPARDKYVAKVRAWIAHQAGVRRIATLSAVSRLLGRNEATLRYAIRAYPGEID
jgi:putative transposase